MVSALVNLKKLTGQTLAATYTEEERALLDEVKTWPEDQKSTIDFWFALGHALTMLAVKGAYCDSTHGAATLRRQEGLDGYAPAIMTDASKLARSEGEVRAWIASLSPMQRGAQRAISPAKIIRGCPIFGYQQEVKAKALSAADLKARNRALEEQVAELKAQIAELEARLAEPSRHQTASLLKAGR